MKKMILTLLISIGLIGGFAVPSKATLYDKPIIVSPYEESIYINDTQRAIGEFYFDETEVEIVSGKDYLIQKDSSDVSRFYVYVNYYATPETTNLYTITFRMLKTSELISCSFSDGSSNIDSTEILYFLWLAS